MIPDGCVSFRLGLCPISARPVGVRVCACACRAPLPMSCPAPTPTLPLQQAGYLPVDACIDGSDVCMNVCTYQLHHVLLNCPFPQKSIDLDSPASCSFLLQFGFENSSNINWLKLCPVRSLAVPQLTNEFADRNSASVHRI